MEVGRPLKALFRLFDMLSLSRIRNEINFEKGELRMQPPPPPGLSRGAQVNAREKEPFNAYAPRSIAARRRIWSARSSQASAC